MGALSTAFSVWPIRPLADPVLLGDLASHFEISSSPHSIKHPGQIFHYGISCNRVKMHVVSYTCCLAMLSIIGLNLPSPGPALEWLVSALSLCGILLRRPFLLHLYLYFRCQRGCVVDLPDTVLWGLDPTCTIPSSFFGRLLATLRCQRFTPTESLSWRPSVIGCSLCLHHACDSSSDVDIGILVRQKGHPKKFEPYLVSLDLEIIGRHRFGKPYQPFRQSWQSWPSGNGAL